MGKIYKKTERLDMRITKEDKMLLDYIAKKCNISSSRYVYMLLDSALLPYKKLIQKGILTYDNIETFLNDKLQLARIFDLQNK